MDRKEYLQDLVSNEVFRVESLEGYDDAPSGSVRLRLLTEKEILENVKSCEYMIKHYESHKKFVLSLIPLVKKHNKEAEL